MADHSSNLVSFNSILWADAELIGFMANYDVAVVTIKESTGLFRDVICRGYIGYELPGFWDEIVIDRGELLDRDTFLNTCRQRISDCFGGNPLNSGCDERNGRVFSQLKIHLSDGCALNIAFGKLEVSTSRDVREAPSCNAADHSREAAGD